MNLWFYGSVTCRRLCSSFLPFHIFFSSFFRVFGGLQTYPSNLILLCYWFCFCILTSWPDVSHSPHLGICCQNLLLCQICKFSVYPAFPLLSCLFIPHPNFTFILSCGFSFGIFSLVEPLRLHLLHIHIPEHAYQSVASHCNGLLFSPCPIFCCLGNHLDNFSYSYP